MIQYRIWDNMAACTQEDVARMCAFVPAGRQAYAMRYRHLFGQWTCLKAWEMVYELTGMNQDWQTGEYGKPYIEGGVAFSISHCRLGVAVVANEKGAVGIDMESVRSVDDALIQRTMNESEQRMIREAVQPEVAFTRLWTQKEAVLKCLGTGIIDDLHGVLEGVEEKGLRVETIERERESESESERKGYIVSICTRNQ